jgi:two-component system, OmpR family, sensor histidine kinase MprB
VAIAVVLASMLTYLLTSQQLRNQVDSQLRVRAASLRFLGGSTASAAPRFPGDRTRRELRQLLAGTTVSSKAKQAGSPVRQDNPFGDLPPRPNQVRGYQQLIDAHGKVLFRSANVTLPVGARTRALAATGGGPFFTDADVQGIHLRVLAERASRGRAVQFAQPLTDVDNLLRRLRLILALLDVGGIALAALLGRLVTGAAVLPLKRLTQATEHVTRTRDLSERIEPTGEDELGRLAVSFNAMLDALGHSMSALDASVHAQRQLVADASHELRTPVTSLRTNIEILQQAHDMDSEERQHILGEVVEQIEELTLLMNDLIDLSRGAESKQDTDDVRLDLVVNEAVDRARRHSPTTSFEIELAPVLLVGVPARLGRAVNNLIDNAVKYSPAHMPVEIRLRAGELTVRDHGSGISAEDLAHVFDRFYRGAEARGRSGSGLGLAIVRQVVEQHGGTVTAEPAHGGGTLMRVRLPGAEALAEETPQAMGTAGRSVA